MLRKTALSRGRGKAANAQEKRHWDYVVRQGCLVCGGGATVHHVTGFADRIGRFPRSHHLVAPLCPQHHQAVFDNASAPQSVERLSHRGFYQVHGIDLLKEAERLWAEFQIEDRRAA